MSRSSAFAVLACVALLPACSGNDPDTEPAPAPGDGVEIGALDVTVRTDRSTYDQNDAVQLTLTARNTSDAPVDLEFTSSQRYDFRVENAAGSTVWTWSATRSFAQVLGEETFAPGEERSWSSTVGADLSPGGYTAVGMVMNRSGPIVDRDRFTIR